MLPAIALLAPAFTLEGATIATSVGAFFTYLWQKNIKSGDNIDFTFDEEMQKLPVEFTNLDNSIATQTASSVSAFENAIKDYNATLQPIKQTIAPSNTTQQVQAKTGLIDVIKSSNIEMIEQQKILNNNLVTQNEILLKTLEAKGSELINQNKLITIMSENLSALNLSVATLATAPKIMATHSDYTITMQGLIYEELTKLTEATKKQELKSTMSINTDNIANAIKDIGSTQNAVNEKTLEKLKLQLSKDITFDGKSYSQAELNKVKDLESLKNVKDENEIDLNESLDLFDELMNDGFDALKNPFAFIYGELLKEFKKDSTEIKTKYNLTEKGI